MTIVEAIKTVLYQVPDGLTSKEIYDEIVKQNLYSFGAKNPLGVEIAKSAEGVQGSTFLRHIRLKCLG